MEKPSFKPHWQVRVVDRERVALLSENRAVVLQGRIYSLLAGLIDGRRSEDEIVDALAGEAAPEMIYYALTRLEQQGYIAEADASLPADEAAFWTSLGVSPAEALRKLQARAVSVTCPALADALRGARIRVAEGGAFRIVVVDDYLDPSLEEWNRRALAAREPWMIVKPRGAAQWLGPIFVPGRTACWKCLAQRVEQNQPSILSVPSGTRPALATTIAAAYNMMATELAKWIVCGDKALEGAVLAIEGAGARRHIVTRRPQCPACGVAEHGDPWRPPPIVLRGGCAREFSAEETCRRLERHVSPVTGIVRELEMNPDAGPTRICVAVQNQVACGARDGSLSRNPFVAVGRGRTEIDAKAGCLGEAIERYSCGWHGDERRLRASYRELREHAVHPAEILLARDVAFDEDAEIDWAPLWSLARECIRFVPAACCYYPYPGDEIRADSNGCAAGNTIEQAVLCAFLELVERDSVAIWWYNRLRRPAVDVASFDDPYFREVREYLASSGRTLAVLDITADLGIPVMAAVSHQAGGGGLLVGFGAHLDARAAVAGALGELSQVVAADPAEQRQAVRDWLATATIENQPYMAPAPGAMRTAADYIGLEPADAVERVGRAGMEPLVLDLTRPDIGFPVARVVVPGLRHFHARLAPGRLYDVPVCMGWLPRAYAEAELNPIEFFL